MRVGFIGLGAMGFPMAQRVVNAGFSTVTMFHRNREPADALVKLGAQIVSTPADVARATDVVITVLPADAQLESIVFGSEGVLKGFSTGKVLIDMTTCTAMTLLKVEQAIQAAGGRVLDAPVSGGTVAAAAGTLTIMVGGDASLLEEYRPLLTAMGNSIFHVGATGQGKVIKITNQAMAAIHLLAMGEAFTLGIRCGADPRTMYEVIRHSSGHSRIMDLRLSDFLFKGNFKPGFKLDLMKKDVMLALESAKASGVPTFLTSTAAQIFTAASNAGLGEVDYSAAAQFLAEMAQSSLKHVSAESEKGQAN